MSGLLWSPFQQKLLLGTSTIPSCRTPATWSRCLLTRLSLSWSSRKVCRSGRWCIQHLVGRKETVPCPRPPVLTAGYAIESDHACRMGLQRGGVRPVPGWPAIVFQ
ncbi:unnamed protein product, partial [Symbiodinium necroappetens]